MPDLFIWGTEVPGEWLQAAADVSWISEPLRPRQATPGGQERVLACGAPPPFVCSFVLVSVATPQHELAEALEWAVGYADDPTATTEADMLSVICGGVVREMDAEELAAEQKLRDYQAGL